MIASIILLAIAFAILSGIFFICYIDERSKKDEIERGIYPFDNPLLGIRCPKCDFNRTYDVSYCECLDYHEAHFHMQCSKCSFRWLMETKQ